MVHGQFEKVLEEVKALTPAERHQLQTWLDSLSAPAPPPMTEAAFAQELCAMGFLSAVTPPLTDFAPYHDRQPIATTGKPLSEVIMEERRSMRPRAQTSTTGEESTA
jgi:hypothetical protein